MTKYNGWTNYETWNVKLWLDNEQGTYHAMTQAAKKVDLSNVADLSDYIKEYVDELYEHLVPDMVASMFCDILESGLSRVNWREIAAAYLEEIED